MVYIQFIIPCSNFIKILSMFVSFSSSHNCCSVAVATECGHSMAGKFVSMPTMMVLISPAYLLIIIITSLQQAVTTSTDQASQWSNLITQKNFFHHHNTYETYPAASCIVLVKMEINSSKPNKMKAIRLTI